MARMNDGGGPEKLPSVHIVMTRRNDAPLTRWRDDFKRIADHWIQDQYNWRHFGKACIQLWS